MTSTSIYSSVIPVSQSKTCNKCNIDKPLEYYFKSNKSKDGCQSKCKSCTKEYYLENKERIKDYQAEYHQTNKEIIKEYREDNKERTKEQTKKCQQEYNKIYRQTNKGTLNAKTVKRNASKLKATPKWCEIDLIKQLYIDCQLISEMTGIKHNVDHKVPLKSDFVCGLHCITNLQIITATENLSKGNRYWPDMA